MAKTESEQNLLPRSFLVRSLEEFVGDLPDDRLLCPVRAVRVYLRVTEALRPRPRALFVSPSCPSGALSKNALSFFIRRVIIDSGMAGEGVSPRAHSVRGVATSIFYAQLVGLQGARGRSLEVEPGFHFILFTRCSFSF